MQNRIAAIMSRLCRFIAPTFVGYHNVTAMPFLGPKQKTPDSANALPGVVLLLTCYF